MCGTEPSHCLTSRPYRPVREISGGHEGTGQRGLQSGVEEEADGAHPVSQLVGATEPEPPGLSYFSRSPFGT